ncbi:hypothetical protein FD755_009972 [Muntiacus reevesi]|uniref:Uncharacterized protein n=1 Tax=Muntiacus reevesi TaxID=9886 RepID=A0A5N3XX07_MUNRE|nr:hypothetical protein FD755_009972 [Muntiacus reevesi]
MKAMQSFKSQGHVKQQFAWRHLSPQLPPPAHWPTKAQQSEGRASCKIHTRGSRERHLQSAMPPDANKKPKAGAGSATEFQFRGGSGCGRGQPPQ